ncbi:MAG: hypothetical protein COV44_11030 [Deltaproteobacteria bacterium CG11_big_fil_rev_8_21_14_0_20_45_16]|nr:MAG: hypothetical protein COV44_11030 [Deltaproteobacteria bacterium CG11_big_fil_rev_8_21_14_0_20_45_16]
MRDHLAFRLAYRGTAFKGFQFQKNVVTIQAKVEEAFARYFKESRRVHFGSRTDAGVHAYDHFVYFPKAFELYTALGVSKRKSFLSSLNFMLGNDIRIWEFGRLSSNFNVMEDIVSKSYSYFILSSPVEDPILTEYFHWIRHSLNLRAMRKAQRQILGTHNFACFAKSSGVSVRNSERGTTRRIYKASIVSRLHPQMKIGQILEFKFEGSGFLRHMVRNMVGTLVQVGEGKGTNIKSILRSGSRLEAGPNLPANSLFLTGTKIRAGLYAPLRPQTE